MSDAPKRKLNEAKHAEAEDRPGPFLRWLMRLQSRTPPCMSWGMDDEQRRRAEETAEAFLDDERRRP